MTHLLVAREDYTTLLETCQLHWLEDVRTLNPEF